jgi:hypothetical protein
MAGRLRAACIRDRRPLLVSRSAYAIGRLAADTTFKKALQAAAVTSEMRAAQREIAFELYLGPAIDECRRRGFTTPLTLAVIYDSLNHGSFDRIAARVRIGETDDAAEFERRWIGAYVRLRDAWLAAISRLRPTRYRTRFFLDEIARANWALDLPLTPNCVRIDEHILSQYLDLPAANPEPPAESPLEPSTPGRPQTTAEPGPPSSAVDNALATAEQIVAPVAERYDRAESIAGAVVKRADSAKSLWTAIAGTVWQPVWAVVGFLIGLPRVVWLTAAVLVTLVLLAYLYRQISLGKIREHSQPYA